MNTNEIYLQHGDVILERCELPEDVKKVKTGKKFIVERGEGVHAHTLLDCDVNVDVYHGKKETLYLVVNNPTDFIHEEHGKKELKPDTYRKVIEREYDYENNEERPVLD